MKYKDLRIVLKNGIEICQRDIGKIIGYIVKSNKKIKFEIDLNKEKDVYKIYRNFVKEIEELKKKI